MITFVFNTESRWDRVYNAIDETIYNFCSYGYKAITAFNDETAVYIRTYCKEHRIAYTEE